MAIPMVPALIFMFWCDLYPRWLRALAVIPIGLFGSVYLDVHMAGRFSWTLYAGYAALQTIEVLWAVYLYRDFQKVATR